MVYAQGLTGMVDLFIHPNYVSSTAPSETPLIMILVAGLVVLILIGVALWVHEQAKERRRKHWEDVESQYKRTPPPG